MKLKSIIFFLITVFIPLGLSAIIPHKIFNGRLHTDLDASSDGGTTKYKIINLAPGTNPNDAVNKSQLDAVDGNIPATLDALADGTTYKRMSSTEQTKLSGIATGAEVNVNADWDAVSGDAQILNKPTIPTGGITAGTTFPGTPSDGEYYHRTDLDCLFFYDSGRAKWLSATEYTVQFGATTLYASVYPRWTGSVPVTTTKGYYVPWNAVITGFSYYSYNTTSCTYYVIRGATTVSTISAGTTPNGSTTSLNDDFLGGGLMAVKLSAARTQNIIVVFYRRTAT